MSKAVSSFHAAGQTTSGDVVKQPVKPASSFVFLCPEFTLTQEEEVLLQGIIHEAKLAPNLTLFDLFFFDLHQALETLNHCVRREDFEKAIEELEVCYATKDVSKLKQFLDGIIRSFILSNNALNYPAPGSGQAVKAFGDTRLIGNTLFERVKLWKKFEGSPGCHPQLFTEPLSTLVGIDKPMATRSSEIKEIFTNNSLFLAFAFNAFRRVYPELDDFKGYVLDVRNQVLAMGSLKSNIYAGETIELKQEVLNVCPPLGKILSESFASYYRIAEEIMKISRFLRTEQVDLAIQTGTMPKIFERVLDRDDKLAQFKADGLVESTFKLTKSESDLLGELFQYPLDSQMTILDLLGLTMDQRMENLKTDSPTIDNKINEAQGRTAAYCLWLYIGLCRSLPIAIEKLGAINAYSEKFALIPHVFPKALNASLGPLEKALQDKPKVLKKFTKTVLPLRDLFIKLLQCKGHFHLLLKAASAYPGGQALDKQSVNGRVVIEKYWYYFKKGYQYGAKAGMFGRGYNFDFIMREKLPFSSPPLEDEMALFGSKIAMESFAYYQNMKILTKDLKDAIYGKLDHPTWLARRNIEKASDKNQQEFHEQLYASSMLFMMLSVFLADMLRLVEVRVYPKGTITTGACFSRLRQNVYMNGLPIECSPSLLPSAITSKIEKIVNRIQLELKQDYELYDFLFYDDTILHGGFNHAQCLEFLLPLESKMTSLFESSLQSLSALKEELLQDLKNEWSTLGFEELQRVDVSATKGAIFQEGLKLVRPLLILSDMLAILQKRHYSEEAAIIPRELADVMELDGIDEILQSLIEAKTPQPVVVEEPSLVRVEEVEQPQVAEPKSKKPAAIKIAQPRIPKAAPIPGIQELAHLTKSRDVLRKLKELKFFEDHQTGSHHILKSPQGGIVVVPNNSNLPFGTRKSIADQAAKALK